jgi:hypothetical protein
MFELLIYDFLVALYLIPNVCFVLNKNQRIAKNFKNYITTLFFKIYKLQI